jgi:RND superfamily putative drug exporter
VTVLPEQDASTVAGGQTLARVRHVADAVPGAGVGGRGAQNADFVSAVYGTFPLMLVLITVVTLVLLTRALRSVVLPIKAVVLNLLSVVATWGALVLVWQHGHGAQLWGSSATQSLTAWVPLMVFAFLYGISMDYEIFILARIREEYDATGDTREAVVRGMARTGPLVTSAALILILAFGAMSAGPDADVKIAASGLAIGLLLDATVVRCLLVPASVALFGRANWWMPKTVLARPLATARKARQSASRG